MYKKIKITTSFGDKIFFKLKCVNTPKEIQKGLMYVKTMPINFGMLFIFDREEITSMWMKNTLIPLDMIFINTNFYIVDIIENTKPNTLNNLTPLIPFKYALEINAGLCEQHGIKFGNEIELIS